MNETERKAINDCMSTLVDNLNSKSVIQYMYSRGMLSRSHFDEMNAIVNGRHRCIELLDTIKHIDCPFATFLDAITDARQLELRQQLEASAGYPVTPTPIRATGATGTSGTSGQTGTTGATGQISSPAPTSISDAMQKMIQVIARRRAMQAARDSLVTIIDASDAAEYFRGKGKWRVAHRYVINPNP